MLAAELRAPDEIVVRDLPVPELDPGDLLLKVKATTICGTDVRIYRGKKTKGVRYPSIIGHEFSGEIVQTNGDGGGFVEGDRVGVDPVVPCGFCEYCLSGMENVCANRRAIGYEFDGSFAEYVRIPKEAVIAGNVRRIADTVSWEAAALAEPLACCINGQQRVGVGVGDSVVVVGAGPIGLMHLKLAKLAGASFVLVSEVHEHRRATALTFGADRVSDPRTESVREAVATVTGGRGVDVVIVAVGHPGAAEEAITWVKKGGRVSLFAGFAPGASITIDPNSVHYNEVTVTGASALKRRDYALAMDLVASADFGIDRLVTHRFALKDITEALRLSELGASSIKVAVHP